MPTTRQFGFGFAIIFAVVAVVMVGVWEAAQWLFSHLDFSMEWK